MRAKRPEVFRGQDYDGFRRNWRQKAEYHEFEDFMRRPSLFRKADLVRATKALQDAGKEVDRVEIDKTGKIVLVVRGERKAFIERPDENEWNSLG